MICGWFVARFLGYLGDVNPDQAPTRIYCPIRGFMSFPYPLLGSPISCREEWMPAVLESLAVAMMVGDLAPYHPLRELGAPVLTPGRQKSELETWVDDGTVAAGAALPAAELAGSAADDPDQRRRVLQQTVAKYLANLDTISKTRKNASDATATRAWELRHDIEQALQEIQRVVTPVGAESGSGLG